MHSLKGIGLAVEQARRQRDALMQAHAQTLRRLAFAQGQWDQLQGYARDTDAKWIASGAQAYTAEVMRHHHQFVGRLQQAIAMQSDVIVGVQVDIDEVHAALLQAEFRLAAIQKLLESRHQQMQKMLDRKEQTQSDELASMQFMRHRKMMMQRVDHGT
jgi:flagellar FliJ protein